MRRVSFGLVLIGLAIAAEQAAAQEPLQLWLYYGTNFQLNQNIPKLEQVWRRAAAAGYTHVLLTDSKFAKLGDLGDMRGRYFANIDRAKRIAQQLKLEIVPALFHIGYSNAMLWHDPNLAEGIPVKDSLFVTRNGEARLVADPPVSLPLKPDWHDPTVHIADGTATVQNNNGNARFVFRVTVAPFRCYHVAVKLKTSNYTGEPKVMPLAGGKALQHQKLAAEPTQDWKEHHVVFNSFDNRQVTLYFGVWDQSAGKLQWKDWRIEEVGLVNVLRRPGAPCVVKGYVEGRDYEPIVDPLLGNRPWKGEYQCWHQPPVIRTKGIADGTELRVSWYHPAIIYDEQVCACPSDPRTLELLKDEAARMKAAWGARGYMMSYDEIRTLNWDPSCQDLKLDAGALLARSVRQSIGLLSGSQVYVWSDMFDPFHNAVNNYYLVRGNLAGSWEGLNKDVIIVNWNHGKRDQSLKFFADRGHRQVLAAYYDTQPAQVRSWLASAASVKGVVGVMYTTWRSNFADIEEFARHVREARRP